MTYNTGNPIGSTDARDRSDNSENMDILENSTTLNAHPDRLGTMRKTRKGMELEHDNQISAHESEHDAQMLSFENDFADRIAKMAFTPVGTFTAGATLTDARQTLLWEVSEGGDGHYYSWSGLFGASGKIVAAGSSPTPITAGSWVDRTDDSLRYEIRETVFQNMRRSYSEAGFNLVDGSFQDGAELSGWPDVLLDWSTGVAYQWHLNEAKTVPSGSTPATSGGIGVNAWVDRTQETIKTSLLSNSGASIVYTSTGETVEERLSSNESDIALKANTADVNAAFADKADINSTKKGGLTQSILANALTLNYAVRLLQFRSSTLTNGTAVEVTPSAAMGLTIPSGAKLGGESGIPLDIFVLGIYNGGSPVIGVVNAGGGLVLDERGLISTTAISATSNSASTIYTTSAVTNSPYVILASLTVTLPTAGAWSVLPTVIPTDLVSVGLLMKRVLYPAVATTSGTSIGFQIPLWAKKITVQFNGVSTSATSGLLLKMGVGGVALSSTYSSSVFVYSNTLLSSTTGFNAGYRQSAADKNDGQTTLTKQSGLSWTAQGYSSSGSGGSHGGSCTLTGVADSLFLTTINGTDTFDAGSVSLLIEG